MWEQDMTTDLFVTLTIVLLLAWEAWTLFNKRPGDTISESMWRAIAKQPLVAFLLGMLMGHWVWLPKACWDLFE